MADVKASVVACLLKVCSEDLHRVLRSPNADEHYGVPLSFLRLAEADLGLADSVLKAPKMALELLDDCLLPAQEALLAGATGADKEQLSVKENAHLRLHSLPYQLDPSPSDLRPAISALASRHIGRLLAISGTVTRSGTVKVFEAKHMYECTRCHRAFVVKADLHEGGAVALPETCPAGSAAAGSAPNGRNSGGGGGCGGGSGGCAGTKFRRVPGWQCFTGYQEIKVQEKAGCLSMGALPCAVAVVLQDEWADSVQPGDDVDVLGIVIPRWNPLRPGNIADGELVVVAHSLQRRSIVAKGSVEVTPDVAAAFRAFWAAHTERPMTGRNKILAGICPQIYGMLIVKLATSLMLIGGVARTEEGGTHIRGECHMLLIGDPGTGKSQIMKFAARLSSRAVTTTGRSSSGAGLTVTAVKDGGQWTLEAGALVLADGGLCVIDEFDGIKEADRAMIHEAMEQQTLHIAKAGMVTQLSTRTSVLGATNPKPSYDPSQPLTAATNLSGPLLSRFDIVMLLMDSRNPHWDRIVSSHVLDNHQAAAAGAAAAAAQQQQQQQQRQQQQQAPSSGWTIDMLQQYVQWAKHSFQPVMTPGAEAVLLAYYKAARRAEERSAARSTIRMLESLIRVAQAHAKLMAADAVTCRDAVISVLVVDSSANVLCMYGFESTLYSTFAEDPDEEFAGQERAVLLALGLLDESEPAPGAAGGGIGGGGGVYSDSQPWQAPPDGRAATHAGGDGDDGGAWWGDAGGDGDADELRPPLAPGNAPLW